MTDPTVPESPSETSSSEKGSKDNRTTVVIIVAFVVGLGLLIVFNMN